MSPDRFIVDIKAQGPRVRQEQFNDEGEIDTKTIRPPIEFALVYYLKNGALKVKVPRANETLAKALKQDFAVAVLKNPGALNLVETRAVNLEEARTFKKLDIPLEYPDITSAQVTSIRFKDFEKGNATYSINDAATLYETLHLRRVDMTHAHIQALGIQFRYTLHNRQKRKTIDLVAKTNRVSTNSSTMDEKLDACLRYWNFINV